MLYVGFLVTFPLYIFMVLMGSKKFESWKDFVDKTPFEVFIGCLTSWVALVYTLYMLYRMFHFHLPQIDF